MTPTRGGRTAALRVTVAAAVGVLAGVVTAVVGPATPAPAVGWTAAGIVYVVWTWGVVGRMDSDRTASHATREDPTRASTDVIVLAASIASLAGVAYLLIGSNAHGGAADASAAIGLLSVVTSWFVVHTVFTLRYANLFYSSHPAGGISFNQDEPPVYADFAYLAFTLGMTYQVSDTDLQNRRVRATALRQALLSYLLGAVVLATAINLVAGLGSSGS